MKIFVSALLLLMTSSLLGSGIETMMKTFKPTAQEIESGAAIIKREWHVVLDEKNRAHETIHYVIAVLNDEAAVDYSQFTFAHNAFYEQQQLDFAVAYTPDGKKKSVHKDAIQIKSSNRASSYDDTKLLQFSMPSVTAGSFIELQLSSEQLHSPLPGEWTGKSYFYRWHANGDMRKVRFDPIRENTVTVDTPEGASLYYKLHNATTAPEIRIEGGRTVYTWTKKDLPRIKAENGTAVSYNEIMPWLSLSTLAKWHRVSDVMYGEYAKASEPSDAIRERALQVTEKAASDEAKIKALYYYMDKNIKYIFAHLGRGGLVPHRSGEIMNQMYGDCKDQATLLVSMLKAVGIEAYPALVNAAEEIVTPDRLPNLQLFNHVIVYVPKYEMWIDTTGTHFTFPGIAWSLGNKVAFVLNGSGGRFRTIPERFNTSDARIAVDFSDDGSYYGGKIRMDLSGAASQFYKSVIAFSQDPEETLLQQFKSLFGAAAVVSNLKYEGAEDPKKEVSFSFEVKGVEQIPDDKREYAALFYGFIRLLALRDVPQEQQRTYGLDLGARSTLQMRMHCKPGSKAFNEWRFVKLPSSYKGKFFEYGFAHKASDDGMVIEERFAVNQRKIYPEAYADFYQQSLTLHQGMLWYLRYTKDERKAAEAQMKAKLDENSTLDSMHALAEHYLDSAEYDKAKALLESAVAKGTAQGRTYYLYGLVLGYSSEFESSSEAFKKAKALGYQPE
ncbi:DUF3857 and transglutaminase domain-containing protein [Sulfurimonas diazotrophicus]|uniref:DUF3857 and transglutaminase domain-containing protein n=1 Tax=Sulfurimonas diazotrophicus TaxID=3131939 RepID=A0ABZ3HD04_9BACT